MPPSSPRPAWQRHLPNALTLARLAMTVAFVAVLSIYRFPDTNPWALPTALVLFIIAALTDAADGWLARRWNVVSVFGRIMDPFADKILILGAFVMLAGPQFLSSDEFVHAQMSGVATWMVVIILSRELLVTTIRAVLESRGVDFSAALSGKLKMIVQSIGVPVILLLVILADRGYDNPGVAAQRAMSSMRQQALRAGASLDASALQHIDSSIEPMTARLHQWAESLEPNTLMDQADRATTLAGLAFWTAVLITLITALSAIPYITRAITALQPPRPA